MQQHPERLRDASRHAAGFTLNELLIVIAIIAVISSIILPNLLYARSNAQERLVIATLRGVLLAQAQARLAGMVDTDNNGTPEFSTLGELIGVDIVRGTADSRLDRAPLRLSAADAGPYFRVSGYYVVLYLPDSSGVGVNPLVDAASIDPDLGASYWTCVAWPARNGITGTASFFVNQQGQILKSTNSPYSGSDLVPPAGPALTTGDPSVIADYQLAVNTLGADGRLWTTVN